MLPRKHKIRPFNMVIRSGSVESILARLFRTTIMDLGVTTRDQYDSLMVRYVQKARYTDDPDKQAALRAGLADELLKEKITWKTLFRGYAFLNIEKVHFTVVIEAHSGEKSSHSVEFDVNETIEPGKVLSNLLRGIFFEKRVVDDKYNELMNNFIDSSRTVIHKRQRATIRAQLHKELYKDSITWKTFVKGLLFLQVPKFNIVTRVYHARKFATEHVIQVIIDGIDNIGDDE